MVENRAVSSPQVSVVLAVYQNIEFFEWTLKSIQSQVGCDFEVVVIDDGNLPEEVAVLRAICALYPNVYLYSNESNVGLTKSLIRGCEIASAPFIARIDNGDIMVPLNRLMLQVKELSRAGVVVCGGGLVVVDVPSGEAYQTKGNGARRTISGAEKETVRTLFPHVTTMFSKAAYVECGGYDELRRVGQDTDLWPRMLRYGNGVVLNTPLAVAPMWKDSISVSKNNAQIRGKVLRLRAAYLEGKALNRLVTLSSIITEYIKLLIPEAARNRLKLRKNYSYMGPVFNKNAHLGDIYSYYAKED